MHPRVYLLSALIFLFASPSLRAQNKDSLWVKPGTNNWRLEHKVIKGESILQLARRYHVPPALLADINKVSLAQEPEAGSLLKIPTGPYNFRTSRPVMSSDLRPLYYRNIKKVDMDLVSKCSGAAPEAILEWSGLRKNSILTGKTLVVGWILYEDKIQSAAGSGGIRVEDGNPDNVRSKDNAETFYVPIKKADTFNADTLLPGEELFLSQTADGVDTLMEKGTAVFFSRPGKNTTGIYFAFHNTAKKGSLIRIRNIGNEKVVFAKVIGPLPGTGQYHNAVLGLSSDARQALEAPGEKLWCELIYPR